MHSPGLENSVHASSMAASTTSTSASTPFPMMRLIVSLSSFVTRSRVWQTRCDALPSTSTTSTMSFAASPSSSTTSSTCLHHLLDYNYLDHGDPDYNYLDHGY